MKNKWVSAVLVSKPQWSSDCQDSTSPSSVHGFCWGKFSSYELLFQIWDRLSMVTWVWSFSSSLYFCIYIKPWNSLNQICAHFRIFVSIHYIPMKCNEMFVHLCKKKKKVIGMLPLLKLFVINGQILEFLTC